MTHHKAPATPSGVDLANTLANATSASWEAVKRDLPTIISADLAQAKADLAAAVKRAETAEQALAASQAAHEASLATVAARVSAAVQASPELTAKPSVARILPSPDFPQGPSPAMNIDDLLLEDDHPHRDLKTVSPEYLRHALNLQAKEIISRLVTTEFTDALAALVAAVKGQWRSCRCRYGCRGLAGGRPEGGHRPHRRPDASRCGTCRVVRRAKYSQFIPLAACMIPLAVIGWLCSLAR